MWTDVAVGWWRPRVHVSLRSSPCRRAFHGKKSCCCDFPVIFGDSLAAGKPTSVFFPDEALGSQGETLLPTLFLHRPRNQDQLQDCDLFKGKSGLVNQALSF